MKPKFYTLFLIVYVLLIQSTTIWGQAAEIVIDGNFDDWKSNITTYTDGIDNPGGIDLLNFQVTNDEKYLYVKITLDTAICLGNNLIDHNLWLSIDADNNPATGYSEDGNYGIDLAINFKDHYAWFNIPDPDIQIPLYKFGLQLLPTVTSKTFEIAIDRNAVPNGTDKLFSGNTIRVMVKESLYHDRMPNKGTVFCYTFDDTPVNTFSPIELNKENPDYIRVITFNIFQNAGWGSYPNIENIERILKALNGDIYCFQECSTNSAEEIKVFMDNWLPTGTNDGWYATKHNDIITCSKWPFLKEIHTLSAKYPTLIDLPNSLYPKDLLIINSHLMYGMDNQRRQKQVDELAAFILDAKTPGGDIDLSENTPIIFLGDMNFVGYAQQPITAITGDIQDTTTYGPRGPLDWDNTDLKDANSLHSDQKMTYTWRTLKTTGTDFPNGRLDYQIYTDAVLAKEKGFILQTGVMSSERLARYNLKKEDSHQVSDHLPHVVDYSFVKTSSILNESNAPRSLKLYFYPNPATNYITINTNGKLQSVTLVDVLGRKVKELPKGSNRMDLIDLPAGIYFLDMKINRIRKTQKIIIIH